MSIGYWKLTMIHHLSSWYIIHHHCVPSKWQLKYSNGNGNIQMAIEIFTHACMIAFTYWFVRSFFLGFISFHFISLIPSAFRPFIHSCVYPFLRSFVHLSIRWFVRSLILPLVRSFMKSSIRSFVQSFVVRSPSYEWTNEWMNERTNEWMNEYGCLTLPQNKCAVNPFERLPHLKKCMADRPTGKSLYGNLYWMSNVGCWMLECRMLDI